MENKVLAQRIKETRKIKGMSQEQLSEESGISLRTIQRIEKGETKPRGDTLKRLSQALNTSPDELLDWRKRADRGFQTFLNLSGLFFLLHPVLGVVIPLALWVLKKDKIKWVDRDGKKLLNFMITNACIYFFTAGFIFLNMEFFKLPILPFKYVFLVTVIIIFIYYANICIQIVVNSFRTYKELEPKYLISFKILR